MLLKLFLLSEKPVNYYACRTIIFLWKALCIMVAYYLMCNALWMTEKAVTPPKDAIT